MFTTCKNYRGIMWYKDKPSRKSSPYLDVKPLEFFQAILLWFLIFQCFFGTSMQSMFLGNLNIWDDRRHLIFSLPRLCIPHCQQLYNMLKAWWTQAHPIIVVIEPWCAHVYVTQCEPHDHIPSEIINVARAEWYIMFDLEVWGEDLHVRKTL